MISQAPAIGASNCAIVLAIEGGPGVPALPLEIVQ